MEKSLNKKIPRGLLIIIVLTILSGGILVIMSIFNLGVSLRLGPQGAMGPTFLMALGVASLVTAFGLYKGKGWAWTLLLILSGFGAAGFLLNVVSGQAFSIAGIVINIIIIYYLYRPHVRRYFGKR